MLILSWRQRLTWISCRITGRCRNSEHVGSHWRKATNRQIRGINHKPFLWMIFSGKVEPKWNNVVLGRLTRKHFQVGSEEWNDVLLTRQRIHWIMDFQSGPSIEVSQEEAIEELEEIPVDRNKTEDLHCTPTMHYKVQKPSGTDKWVLQSRTQFQCCHKLSRCAPKAASPTTGDVKAFNKQAGKTIQGAASETSILATHWTVENNWIP